MAFIIKENMSLKNFEKEISDLMRPSVDFFEKELAKLRTNRAHPSLIEDIKILLSNSQHTVLKKIALITVTESNMLLIKPFDVDSISYIEKALSTSDLNLNPKNEGNIVKIVLPPMSKERRLDLVKLVTKKMEESLIQIRKIRQDILGEIKKTEKSKDISQDFSQRLQKILQLVFDQFSQLMLQLAKKKELSLLQD